MKVQTWWTQPQMPTFALEKDLKNCQDATSRDDKGNV